LCKEGLPAVKQIQIYPRWKFENSPTLRKGNMWTYSSGLTLLGNSIPEGIS